MSLAGLLSSCAYIYLTYHSQQYAQATLFDLFLSCGMAALICISAWCYMHKRKQSIPIFTLLFWALVFRLIGISAFPVLEDDFYRYLWDGYQFVTTGSPYTHPPSYFFDSNELNAIFDNILSSINYPYITTVYAPVTQWVFALSYLIAPGEVWPLQLIFSILDMALIGLMLRLASAKYVLLYAWNPLIIKEVAFTAHPDILGVFLLFAACITRKHIFYTAILLALAFAAKVFAIIIAPLLLGFRWRSWLVFLVTLLIICIPFLDDFMHLTAGLSSMADVWLFNAPIYILLLNIISVISIKLVLLAVFTSFWICYAYRYTRIHSIQLPRGDLLFGLFLLCIPVLNPWYLIWLLPFAVVYPSYSAWISSIAVLLSYAIGLNLNNINLEPYEQPNWVITLEFSVILFALLFDLYRSKNNYRIDNK